MLVVDGDLFAHRSYHALPKSIRRVGDKGGGAILGFANVLMRLYANERPRAVLVGWDTLEASTYRQAALPAYQSGREFDDELVEQLDVLPEFVTACGFVNAKAAGYEADDFLAAAAAKEERRAGCVVIATGDRDAYQLASQRTTILQPIKAGEMARIGPAEVRERYGVEPQQVPDFIALRGDASDKIPGAKGIGAKTAAALLRKHASLEELIGAGRFQAQADELRLYRKIATMDRSAPLPSLRGQKPTWDKAAKLARAWQLNRLADRLAELARSPAVARPCFQENSATRKGPVASGVRAKRRRTASPGYAGDNACALPSWGHARFGGVDPCAIASGAAGGRRGSSIEVELQTCLRPLHHCQPPRIGQCNVGGAHIGAAEANVGWIAIRHRNGADNVACW